MSQYDVTFFQYFQNLKRQIQVSPLNLGGTAVSSGGPPGGFTGWLPQNRVGYDATEASISGFASPSAYNPSGILVNASLVDNLNHIRYRLGVVEALAFTGNYVSVYENQVLVASGVTILNFEGSVNVEETAPAEVTVTITASGGSGSFTGLSDTPSSYTGQALMGLRVNSGETGLEFVALSGGSSTDEKVKVSSNDITEDYLENKIIAGANVGITVLNEGGNEVLQITASGGGSVSSAFSGAVLTKSSTQSIGTATATAISFDGEVYDTDDYHSNVTNTTRLTAPADGYYLVGGSVEMSELSDLNYVILRIRKNGSDNDGDGRSRHTVSTTGTSGYLSPNISRVVNLNEGEYVELLVEHNYGSARDARSSSNGTSFWIYKLNSYSGGITNLGWYNIIDYGGVGDGITDDTTAINDTISAIPASGGVLYSPPGYNFLSTGGHTLNKPITVKGMGNARDYDSAIGVSTITCSSSTADLFTVSSEGCNFEDIFLKNSAGSPSAGSAIVVASGSGNDLVHFKNVTSHSFYNGIDIRDGWSWHLDHCFIVNAVNYGLKIQHQDFPDGGDQFISDSTFWSNTRDTVAAIRYESGGGLKINNTKIVGSEQSNTQFNYGIDVAIGANVNTSVFLVSNTSIENIAINGIRLTTNASKPSGLDLVLLNNLEIAMNNEGSGSSAILISPDASGDIDWVIIDNAILLDWDNTITDPAIQLTNVNHARIGSILNSNFNTLLGTTNCTDVLTQYASMVSANDTTPAYLEDKIVAGSNVSITVLGEGGNESLSISATGSGGGGGAFAGVKAYNNANITIPNNSPTVPTFNSEYWDTGGFHSTSSNTDRLTATVSGWYQVGCMFKWDDNTSGVREAGFIKNGGTYFAYHRLTPQTANTMVSFTETINLAIGEYVTMIVYQNRGGDLDMIYGAEYTPNFWMNYLGS